MTTPEPTPEWLEKWREELLAWERGATKTSTLLTAIYSEVYAEAVDATMHQRLDSLEASIVEREAKAQRETLERISRHWDSMTEQGSDLILAFAIWLAEQLKEADDET